MNKELTKEEAEEFYNKLWLENKELIQENMNKLSMERYELELEIVDKDKEIERLNNIINEIERYIEEWQRFPHTNGSTHKELKNLIDILDKVGDDYQKEE